MACEIVAELSNNHNGDRDRLGRLIDAAQSAGADAVKFQCYTPDELVALRGNGPAPQPWGGMGYTMRSLYEKAQTPLAWFPKIRDHCERIGMPWFSSVFGLQSYTALESVGCPRYKVSHFECQNEMLLSFLTKSLTETDVDDIGTVAMVKPLLVSYPVRCAEHNAVYCPGGYPASASEMHIDGPIWGLSSHCRDPLVAPLAIARGAQYLEYHMMLREEPSELESNVSLDQYEFADMVKSVRDAEVLLS